MPADPSISRGLTAWAVPPAHVAFLGLSLAWPVISWPSDLIRSLGGSVLLLALLSHCSVPQSLCYLIKQVRGLHQMISKVPLEANVYSALISPHKILKSSGILRAMAGQGRSPRERNEVSRTFQLPLSPGPPSSTRPGEAANFPSQ